MASTRNCLKNDKFRKKREKNDKNRQSKRKKRQNFTNRIPDRLLTATPTDSFVLFDLDEIWHEFSKGHGLDNGAKNNPEKKLISYLGRCL